MYFCLLSLLVFLSFFSLSFSCPLPFYSSKRFCGMMNCWWSIMRLCLRLPWGSHWHQRPKKIKQGVGEIEFYVLLDQPQPCYILQYIAICYILYIIGSTKLLHTRLSIECLDRRPFIGPSGDNYNNSSAVPPGSACVWEHILLNRTS